MGRRTPTFAMLLFALLVFMAEPGVSGGEEASIPVGSAVHCDEVLTEGAEPDEFVAALRAGETGCLRAGLHEVEQIAIVKAPEVTLTSYPGESATLAGRLWIRRGADRAVVENLTLDGRNDAGKPSPTVNADGTVFRGNDVSNGHTAICFVVGDDAYGAADRTVIESNRIHDCGRLPPANHDHGIYVAHADGTRIINNLIYDNADRGVQLYPDADGTIVFGNVIDGNGQGVIFGGDENEASDGNLVVGNLITSSRVRYNIESHWQGPVGQGNLAIANCVWTDRDEYSGRPRGSGVEPSLDGVVAVRNAALDPDYTNPAVGDFGAGNEPRCPLPASVRD